MKHRLRAETKSCVVRKAGLGVGDPGSQELQGRDTEARDCLWRQVEVGGQIGRIIYCVRRRIVTMATQPCVLYGKSPLITDSPVRPGLA